jgi:gliding motility-associated-like protein
MLLAGMLWLLLPRAASAQVQVMNDGAVIKIDADVIVDGDIFHQNNGSITNSGDLYFTGDWTNNNPAGQVNTPGLTGWTHLVGAGQTITGTRITLFNKLELSGTGIKDLLDISTIVDDTLALNDREFAADTNTVFVTSTATGVITRTSGFVSALANGGLSRNTALSSAYLYPVGSSTGTLRYRPVEITPNSATANTFKVRMANVDATTETYNRNTHDTILCYINPLFYHRVHHTSGASTADVSLYFDAAADGSWQTIAHWQNQPRWENTGTTVLTPSPTLSSQTINAWNDYSYTPFGLANIAPLATLSNQTVCAGQPATFAATPGYNNYDFYLNGTLVQSSSSDIYISNTLANGDVVNVIVSNTATCPGTSNNAVATVNPQPNILVTGDTTVFLGQEVELTASGAQSYNWQPGGYTSSTALVTPSTTTTFTVEGTDINGCSDTTFITLYVNGECGEVFVPTAFSPNGDGQNDYECVMGYCIRTMLFKVYDRWGEQVFESADPSDCWDGTYKGQPVNSGVFVYFLGAELITGEKIVKKGNISLVR